MAPHRLVGALLILIGLVLLVVLQSGVGGEVAPLLVGVGFLVAYALTRQYGFLVPGAILAGLGTGIVVVTSTHAAGSAPVLGLGAGFLAIALIDWLVRGATPGFWWPLIPGGVLTFVGVMTLPAARDVMGYLMPAALVLIGVLLIFGRRKPSGNKGDHEPVARR